VSSNLEKYATNIVLLMKLLRIWAQYDFAIQRGSQVKIICLRS